MTDTTAPKELPQDTADAKLKAESEPTAMAMKEESAVIDESASASDNDEEENFLQNIEKKEAAIKDEENQNFHQPDDASAAPRLLQDAIKKGDVKESDSEAEEKKDEGQATIKDEGADGSAGAEKEKVHQRV